MKRITIKTPDDLHDKALAKAQKQGRNLSTVGRMLFEKWLRGEISLDESDSLKVHTTRQ